MQEFSEEGVAFRYPDNWRLEREEGESGWTVLLQSPGTAFMTITCDADMPTVEEMAEAAVDALREDYPQLEAEPCIESLAGQMAIGHDIQFFSLDMTNTCWTRSFYSNMGTMLVLCQATDQELEEYEPQLRAICASLQVEED
jgi:hypothetical protein